MDAEHQPPDGETSRQRVDLTAAGYQPLTIRVPQGTTGATLVVVLSGCRRYRCERSSSTTASTFNRPAPTTHDVADPARILSIRSSHSSRQSHAHPCEESESEPRSVFIQRGEPCRAGSEWNRTDLGITDGRRDGAHARSSTARFLRRDSPRQLSHTPTAPSAEPYDCPAWGAIIFRTNIKDTDNRWPARRH